MLSDLREYCTYSLSEQKAASLGPAARKANSSRWSHLWWVMGSCLSGSLLAESFISWCQGGPGLPSPSAINALSIIDSGNLLRQRVIL